MGGRPKEEAQVEHGLAHGAAALTDDSGVPAQPRLEQRAVSGRRQLEELVEHGVYVRRRIAAAEAARLAHGRVAVAHSASALLHAAPDAGEPRLCRALAREPPLLRLGLRVRRRCVGGVYVVPRARRIVARVPHQVQHRSTGVIALDRAHLWAAHKPVGHALCRLHVLDSGCEAESACFEPC